MLSKLTVPIGLAISLGGAVVGATGSFVANKVQVAELTKSVEESARRVDKLRDQRAEDREQVVEIRSDVKQMTKSLDRIEKWLGTKR